AEEAGEVSGVVPGLEGEPLTTEPRPPHLAQLFEGELPVLPPVVRHPRMGRVDRPRRLADVVKKMLVARLAIAGVLLRRPKHVPEHRRPAPEPSDDEDRIVSQVRSLGHGLFRKGEFPGTSETRQSAGSRKWPHRSPRLSLS